MVAGGAWPSDATMTKLMECHVAVHGGAMNRRVRAAGLLAITMVVLLFSPGAAATRTPEPSDLDFDWPTGGPVAVLRAFDLPTQRWQSGHRGVDLEAGVGSPVRAAGAGRVAFAGKVGGKPVVALEHAGGLRTTYEPVQALVSVGDVVARGEVIGELLSGHCEGASCLHWGAKYGTGRSEQYIDPLLLLQPLRYRLVPDRD